MAMTCANCGKPIFRLANQGDYYHKRTASTSCYPGRGHWKRATPREIEDAPKPKAED